MPPIETDRIEGGRPQHRDAALLHRLRDDASSSAARCPTCATASSRCTAASSTPCTTAATGPDRGFNKCSRVVGDVMGQYHPHGDTLDLRRPGAPGAGLVAALPAGRRARATSARPGDDPAAAPRYTECRMAPLAMEMVRDIDQETVDFQDNYDGRTQEPVGPAQPLPEPAGQRLGRHRGRHGHQHPAAQPARGRRGRAVVPPEPGGAARGAARGADAARSRARTSPPAR